jgi:hypothetical protein
MIRAKKIRAKKIGIWLLALALFATQVLLRSSAHADEVSSWKQIYAITGDCRISFPTVPKMLQQALKVSEDGDHLTYDVYLSPLNEKALCLLLVAIYPFPLKSGQELAGIEGLLSGIVGHHPDNKLVFAKLIDHKGIPVVDFLVQSPSSYFRGHALMKGNKLYLIAIEGKQGELNEKTFRDFSSTFSLVP